MKTFDEIWNQIHKETEWGKYPSEEVIRFVARNFYNENRKNIKILDFGCGTGAITWYLAREGFDTYGFDGSKVAIDKAKARMIKEGLEAKLEVSDASKLPYDDEFFDGLIDSAVIYANKYDLILVILNECNRVLKKGGKFFSTGLFNSETTGYGTGEFIEEGTYRELEFGPLKHRGTVHFFTLEEIRYLWGKAGFEILNIDYIKRSDKGGKWVISYYIVEAVKM